MKNKNNIIPELCNLNSDADGLFKLYNLKIKVFPSYYSL